MGKKTKTTNLPVEASEESLASVSVRHKIITISFLFILIYTLFTRFYDLGYKAYHHDESIHAYYSWILAKDGPTTYKYDPVYHGPFLYFANALVYRICGGLFHVVANDANSRYIPAFFGSILIILSYCLKRFIDQRSAVFIALLAAVSPTLTYFARFIRHDIYIPVYTLGMIICFLYYWREKKQDYLYFSFALAALSFVTKEDTYITMFIFFSFIFFYSLVELCTNTLHKMPNVNSYIKSSTLDFLKVTFSILFLKIITLDSLESYLQDNSENSKDKPISFRRFIDNIKKEPIAFLNGVFIFFVICAVFFTSFFTNPKGIFDGIFGFFTYWVFNQQVKPRIPGPFHYYISKLFLYEFTIVFFVIIGIGYLLWRKDKVSPLIFYSSIVAIYTYSFCRDSVACLSEKYILYPVCAVGFFYVLWGIFRMIFYLKGKDTFLSFVIYWSLSSLFIYSYAQEKVPWLMTHIVFPFTVLAGLCIGKIFNEGKTYFKYITGIILVLLLICNIYVSARVNFEFPDNPIEPMIFTQTSRNVVETSNKIKAIVKQIKNKEKIDKIPYTIYIDDEASWPFVWYLKDLEVSYVLPTSLEDVKRALAVISSPEKQNKVEPLLAGNFSGERLILRAWWIADNVKLFTLWQDNKAEFFKTLYNFIVFRQVWSTTGSTDYILYLRKDYSDLPPIKNNPDTAKLHTVEERPLTMSPTVFEHGVIIGNAGIGNGQFMTPRALALDSDGNIYAADSYNHRVQKFSPEGKFLISWGKEGEAEGDFHEPCGLAVDGKRGYVYVADTWNHRIQRFSLNGEFQLSWKGEFYGPRAIVLDGNGDLYISDTGNCVIKKYNSNGELLCQFGSKGSDDGQFQEPIGLAMDMSGNIIVADTWNQRIQFFSPVGGFIKKFDVQGWYGLNNIREPYLVINSKGNLLLTDSSQQKILEYTPEGKLLFVFCIKDVSGKLFTPTGIALNSKDGKLIVSDIVNNCIQIIDFNK